MKNSNNMKNIMNSWRSKNKEDLARQIIKEEVTKALLGDPTHFAEEDRRVMKEHKLTEAEVYQMMDEGKWDDFKGWAGKKAKAAGKAAKDIATADVGDIARAGASAVKSTAHSAKQAGKSAKDYAREKGVKGMASDAKGHAKDALAKLDRVWQGAKEIGIGGAEATNLGGEETFDIEKRKAAKDKGASELEGSLRKVGYEPLSSLFDQLLKMDWPNFKGKSRQRDTREPAPDSIDMDTSDFDESLNLKEGHSEDFAKGMQMIQSAYDQIVGEFNQSEKTEEDATTANTRISSARDLALYFMDYVLADRGSYLREAEEGAVSKNYQSVYAAKLPLGLAVAGTALLASGLNMEDKFVQNAIKKAPEDLDGMSEELADNLSKGIDVRSGEGWSQAMQRATSINMAPDAPIGNLLDPKVQNLSDVIGDSFTHPEGRATMEEVFKLAESEPDMTFGELFKRQSALSGRGDSIGDLLPIKPGSFFRNLTDTAVKATVSKAKKKGGEKLVKAAASSALGPILSGLGVAALGGGAASALMRAKGKYGGSQMASLQKLVDGFKDVKVGEKEEEPVPPVPPVKGEEEPVPPVPPVKGKEKLEVPPKKKKDKDVKAKSGPGVPVFKKGDHASQGNSVALQKTLARLDLPKWAMHGITKFVAHQLRKNGHEVQESLEEWSLPFSSQAKVDDFLKDLPPDTPEEDAAKIKNATKKAAQKAAKENPGNAEDAVEDATDQIISQAADVLDLQPPPLPDAAKTDDPANTPSGLANRGDTEHELPLLDKHLEVTPGKFNISGLKDYLQTGAPRGQEIDPKQIKAILAAVNAFVRPYVKDMQESESMLSESLKKKWKNLAGI